MTEIKKSDFDNIRKARHDKSLCIEMLSHSVCVAEVGAAIETTVGRINATDQQNDQKNTKAKSREPTTEKIKIDQRMRKSTGIKIGAAEADRKIEVAGHERED